MNWRYLWGGLLSLLLVVLGLQSSLPDMRKLPPVNRVDARVYQGDQNTAPWVSFNPQLQARPALLASAPDQLIEYRYHIDTRAIASLSRHDTLLITQAINGVALAGTTPPTVILPLSTADTRTVWYRPALVPLPNHARGEQLVISTRSWEPHLFISPMYTGPYDTLFWAHEIIHFISTSLAYAGTLISLLFGLFFLHIWLGQRQERLYLFAAVTALSWCVLFLLADIPSQASQLRHIWRFFIYCTIATSFWGISEFIGVYAHAKQSRFVWLVRAGIAVSGPLAYVVLRTQEPFLDRYWTLCLYMVVALPLFHLLRHWRRNLTDGITQLMTASTVTCLYFAYQSQQLISGFVDKNAANDRVILADFIDTPVYVVNLFLPLFFVISSLMFIERYRVINQKLADAADLMRSKLQQQAVEINLLHAEKLIQEKKEAAEAERNAIHRDLHDGIGARLVACLYKLRENRMSGSQLEEALMESLTDIKKIINASPSQPVSDFSGHVFERCLDLEDVFVPAHIEFTYHISHDVSVSLLHSIDTHILYIFQEIVSNFIKHSSATTLRVELLVDQVLTLQVTECDYPVEGGQQKYSAAQHPPSSGRGMANMHARALIIAAHLDIEQQPDRRTTRLTVPIHPL